jgi:dUTP pyrophosphatase
MLLSKNEIMKKISEGLLVQDMIDPGVQVQQCGVDLTVSKVFRLDGEGVLDFTNEKRRLPKYVELPAHDDKWILEPGIYHIGFNEKIVLPDDIAGILLPRSSALVCGIVQHSALWDPGYEGRSFFHAEVSKRVTIHRNARIGQMVFFRLNERTEPYSGIFKGEDILKKARS